MKIICLTLAFAAVLPMQRGGGRGGVQPLTITTPAWIDGVMFALDTMLDVTAVGASPPQTRAAVAAAMAGRVRGKGVYTGIYRRHTMTPS